MQGRYLCRWRGSYPRPRRIAEPAETLARRLLHLMGMGFPGSHPLFLASGYARTKYSQLCFYECDLLMLWGPFDNRVTVSWRHCSKAKVIHIDIDRPKSAKREVDISYEGDVKAYLQLLACSAQPGRGLAGKNKCLEKNTFEILQ